MAAHETPADRLILGEEDAIDVPRAVEDVDDFHDIAFNGGSLLWLLEGHVTYTFPKADRRAMCGSQSQLAFSFRVC